VFSIRHCLTQESPVLHEGQGGYNINLNQLQGRVLVDISITVATPPFFGPNDDMLIDTK